MLQTKLWRCFTSLRLFLPPPSQKSRLRCWFRVNFSTFSLLIYSRTWTPSTMAYTNQEVFQQIYDVGRTTAGTRAGSSIVSLTSPLHLVRRSRLTALAHLMALTVIFCSRRSSAIDTPPPFHRYWYLRECCAGRLNFHYWTGNGS